MCRNSVYRCRRGTQARASMSKVQRCRWFRCQASHDDRAWCTVAAKYYSCSHIIHQRRMLFSSSACRRASSRVVLIFLKEVTLVKFLTSGGRLLKKIWPELKKHLCTSLCFFKLCVYVTSVPRRPIVSCSITRKFNFVCT